MMKLLKILSVFLLLNTTEKSAAQKSNTKVEYINEFENTQHPEIAYWFFNKEMLNEASYKRKIDSLSAFGKFTLLFITARNGVDFYDSKTMHPVFTKLVQYAHQKGLKIGLQLWEKRGNVSIENTERLIQEGEVALDDKGFAEYSTLSKHARDMKLLIKSDLFKVLVFKKVSEGYYDATTLKDITYLCKAESDKKSVSVKINCGNDCKGYTAYILTQHYYNFNSNHSEAAKINLIDILRAYSDISFDGVGLDEYTNLRVSTTWELKNTNEIFRERSYSLSMASQFQKKTGEEWKKWNSKMEEAKEIYENNMKFHREEADKQIAKVKEEIAIVNSELERIKEETRKAMEPVEDMKRQEKIKLNEASLILERAKVKEEENEETANTLQDKLDEVGEREMNVRIQDGRKSEVKEYNSTSSKTNSIKPEKPDGTVETINGKRYYWLNGYKMQADE